MWSMFGYIYVEIVFIEYHNDYLQAEATIGFYQNWFVGLKSILPNDSQIPIPKHQYYHQEFNLP